MNELVTEFVIMINYWKKTMRRKCDVKLLPVDVCI